MMISPSSERIITQSEAIKNGWSQAQWMLQQKYNAGIMERQSRNSQAVSQTQLAPSQQLVNAQASNQITASEKSMPKVGDYIMDPGLVKEGWMLKFKINNPNSTGYDLPEAEFTVVKINHNRRSWLGKINNTRDYDRFAMEGNLNYLSMEAARDGGVKFAGLSDVADLTKPLPFKRHPKCEEKAVHMTAQMCLGCERQMRYENDRKDPYTFIECDGIADDEKLNEHMPSGVISGYGSLVGGSWNGRVP